VLILTKFTISDTVNTKNRQHQKRKYFNQSIHYINISLDLVRANLSYCTKHGKILFLNEQNLIPKGKSSKSNAPYGGGHAS
jgi:hypothetical protein